MRWVIWLCFWFVTVPARAEPEGEASRPAPGDVGPPLPPPPSPPAPSAVEPSSSAAPASPTSPASALPATDAQPPTTAGTLPPVAPPPLAPAPLAPGPPLITSVAPSAASAAAPPAASGSAITRSGAVVRLGDASVFTVRTSRSGRSAEERARTVSRALALAVDDPRAAEVKVVREGETAVVYVGPAPLIQLVEQDARLAGDSSLDVHANTVASSVRQALTSERRRSRVAQNVFSLSLVVFFALIAFYLMRKVGEVAERIRAWLDENGDRVLAIRVQKIEVVRPAMLKSTAVVALGLAKWIGQFGILYAWLVIVLSLFESTRGYTERLTGFVVAPLSGLMSRLASALPLLVVASLAALAVFVLVRFVGLFFASVARRETSLAWLPSDLAAPTSVLLRFGIVLAALIFAAPIVTGEDDDALGRAGAVALAALGLSGVPLLASGLVGSIVLFGRRLRVGEHAEIGGSIGRISAINLLELRLTTIDHTELRIPHLLLLGRPLRGLGTRPRLSVEIAVDSSVPPTTVQRLFDEAASRVGRDVRAEVLAVDAVGIVYRVSATCDSLEERSRLTTSVVEALAAAGVPLGKSSGAARLA